jgi:hypothetical protein
MDHVKLSNDAESQMFYPIIQVSHPILSNIQEMFVTTSVNSRKFSSQNEVVGSMYILYKSIW